MPNLIIHGISDAALIGVLYLTKQKPVKNSVRFNSIVWQIILSNLIDLDHLLANPIYDPARCSLNFHPLHSWYIFPLYFAGLFSKKYRYFFIGIILHLILDYADCWF